MLTPQNTPEVMESIKKAHSATFQEIKNDSVRLDSNQLDTVKTLAIVSGALATGSLVLLASPVPISRGAVVWGAMFLLLEVVVVFGFLIHKHVLDNRNWFDNRKRALVPTAKILLLFEQLRDRKIDFEAFKAGSVEITTVVDKAWRENNEKLVAEQKFPRTYWEFLFFIPLGVGSILIIYGFLSPLFS